MKKWFSKKAKKSSSNLFAKKLALALLFPLLPLLAHSQNYSIKGTVVDKDSKLPLAGTTIQILNTFKATTSDLHGNFEFKNLSAGEYTLIFTYIGYKKTEKKLTLNQNEEIRIEMEFDAIMKETVVISGSRAGERTPGAWQNISSEQIAIKNQGRDIPYLLELTPSLVTTSDAGAGIGYTGLRIRGTDVNRINVTLNNVPLNDPESHGVYWVDWPDLASSVNNIQIQRGVGTSSNGVAAFGASINIQNNSISTTPFGEINTNAGSFNTLSNNIRFGTGLLNGVWGIEGRLSKIYSDGYIDRAFSDLRSQHINAGYFGEKTIVRFMLLNGKEKTYQAWMGVPKDSLKTNRRFNPYTYENETDNYFQTHYHLSITNQLTKNFHINSTLFFVDGGGYFEQHKTDVNLNSYGLQNIIIQNDTISETDLIQQKHLDNDFYGINIMANYDTKKKLKLNFGIYGSNFDNNHFGKIIWMEYAGPYFINTEWYRNKGIKKDGSIFSNLTYQINKNLSFYTDLQFRYINHKFTGINDKLRDIGQQHTFQFFNPKTGIYYSLNNNNDIYASISIAHREPNRNNLVDADPGRTPTFERLTDYELGYILRQKNFMLNINTYYMHYDNQLVLTGEINNVGEPIMTNVKTSYRTGVELITSVLLSPKIKLNANATFSENKILNFTEYVDDWDTWTQRQFFYKKTTIAFSPSIISAFELTYNPINNLDIYFTTKYVGKQYIDNTQSKERMLDDYHTSNLIIAYRIKTNWVETLELKLGIYNIFNQLYENNAWVYRYFENNQPKTLDGYFPQAGINYLAGVKIRF